MRKGRGEIIALCLASLCSHGSNDNDWIMTGLAGALDRKEGKEEDVRWRYCMYVHLVGSLDMSVMLAVSRPYHLPRIETDEANAAAPMVWPQLKGN